MFIDGTWREADRTKGQRESEKHRNKGQGDTKIVKNTGRQWSTEYVHETNLKWSQGAVTVVTVAS